MGILFKRTTHHCDIAFKDIMGNVYDHRKSNTLHAQNALSFFFQAFVSFLLLLKECSNFIFLLFDTHFYDKHVELFELDSASNIFIYLLHRYELPSIIVYGHPCFVDAFISTDTVSIHLTFFHCVWRRFSLEILPFRSMAIREHVAVGFLTSENRIMKRMVIEFNVFYLALKSGSLFSANCEIISYWLHIADRWCLSL